MAGRFKGFVGLIAAGSLFVSSTGAVAAASSAPIPQVHPWAALAVMSGATPAAVVCGGAAVAAAAAQPVTNCVLPVVDPAAVAAPPPPQPIPVPPVEPAGGLGLGIDPLLLGLGAVLLGVGLYFLLKKKDDDDEADSPT